MDQSERESQWLSEIIRETEHYYLGEMQQEERASWLLGTSSALLAIIISVNISIVEGKIFFPKIFLIIPFVSFSISACLAIWTLLPLTGTKGVKLFFGDYLQTADAASLIKEKFKPDENWSATSFNNRVFHHFRSHYLRNMQKGRGVMMSSVFLFVGLLSSIIMGVIGLLIV